MWAAVRENFDFLTVVNYTIFAAIIKKKKKEEEVYLPMLKKITMAGCQYRLKPIKAGCQQ